MKTYDRNTLFEPIHASFLFLEKIFVLFLKELLFHQILHCWIQQERYNQRAISMPQQFLEYSMCFRIYVCFETKNKILMLRKTQNISQDEN